jgi:uncharacterized protein YbjT (DUF2867 family)
MPPPCASTILKQIDKGRFSLGSISMTKRVLVLGADGFIGRHFAFELRQSGFQVIASARHTARLERMGFETLPADLTNPATHDPAFWRSALANDTCIVNAAGLLTGSDSEFHAVHVAAPAAAYAALTGTGVLISAIGIGTDTNFARYRREGERLALACSKITILRPGLVLGDTSYGGSSLLRALAAFPSATPVIGTGNQRFNPIHVTDLAQLVKDLLSCPVSPGPHAVGGPEIIVMADLLALYRRWFGLPATRVLSLPLPLARVLGRLGDAMRLGPVSATAVAQLESGVLATPTTLSDQMGFKPRAASEFVAHRPAGTQDLWHARLYLLRPLLRLTLAFLWLASGLAGLFLPPASFIPLLTGGFLSDPVLLGLARAGGLADLGIALALMRNWRPRQLALLQLLLIGGYTVGLTVLAPSLWLDPFGGILKNLPISALVLVTLALSEER